MVSNRVHKSSCHFWLNKILGACTDCQRDGENCLKIQMEMLQSQFVGIQNQLTNKQNQLTNQQNQLEALQANPSGIMYKNSNKMTCNGHFSNKIIVPIGFVYVQLSGQSEPSRLWPEIQWDNISSTYAGLFFRVIGGGSDTFGATQNENAPRISEIKNVHGMGNHNITVTANGDWSSPLWTGSDLGCVRPIYPCYWSTHFKQSAGEVRPRNQAVRIWKRIM